LRAGVANDDWKRETFAKLGRTLKDSTTQKLSAATTVVTSREVGADTLTMKRLQGVFGEVVLNYNDIIYLTGTGRNDWTSTLPVQARSFFYPAVSLAVIMSDIIAPDSKAGIPMHLQFLQMVMDGLMTSIIKTQKLFLKDKRLMRSELRCVFLITVLVLSTHSITQEILTRSFVLFV
jgi:hypothetical protein